MSLRRITAALLACALLTVTTRAANAPSVSSLVPAEHRRTPDQTFLTFPEWYLVHSPAEYAAFLAETDQPSRFPLFAHIGQFWRSYAVITSEIRDYPFNPGYHLMVMVIGVSTTVEYALKGLYEHTIGRLAELTKTSSPVPEEVFAARYAQAYVDFIRVDPWYLFDFKAQLVKLWSDVPQKGPNLVRRWERRYLLTSELLIKEGYARLIKLGTQTIYDAPKPVTAIVIDKPPRPDAAHREYKLLAPTVGTQPVYATIPRYEAFNDYSRWLAQQGIDFLSIAGNEGEIVLSEIIRNDTERPADARLLFEQPILTRPGYARIVIAVKVKQLGAELRRAASTRETVIEHVYDF